VIGGGVGVAWFPLGPRDVWVPAYHCSPAYVQNVNIRNTRVVNVTQVTTVYNNVYINHNTTVVNNYTYANNVTAVTAVSRTTFVSGQNVSKASVHITQEQIRNPQVTQGAPPMVPTRQSRVGTNAVSNKMPPAALANRAVVTKMAPAPQVVPIGHTQSFANSGGFKPTATPGSNRPGAPPNPNTGRPGAPPPAASNPNVNSNVKPNGQPVNAPHPGFQRPPANNPNGNGSGNANGKVNSNAQPNNTARPAFQPPAHNNPNETGTKNEKSDAQPNRQPEERKQVQPPPKPANPPKESKESKDESDKHKKQDNDHP
jgi:hypothetical protein